MTIPDLPSGYHADDTVGAYADVRLWLNAVKDTAEGSVQTDDPRLSDQRTPTDNSVTSAKIVDGAIVDADINASAAIAQSKISGLATALAAKAPRSALYTPGTSGNYASAPYVAAFGITGDLDVRWIGSLDLWTQPYRMFVSRSGNAPLKCWYFMSGDGTGATKKLQFVWSVDGTATATVASTASVPFADGSIGGVRVTVDVDNGAGGYDIKFWTSSDEGVTWTQLGSTITGGAPTSIYNNASQPMEVGSYIAGTNPITGRTLKAEVRNGINGTVVASPDFTAPRGPRMRDGQGNIWSINGSAWAWAGA